MWQGVAVVGAGLVGSLEACYLARRGIEVHVYEYRQKTVTSQASQARSNARVHFL